jgi:hypothetical protein
MRSRSTRRLRVSKRNQIIATHLNTWRNLRAWGRSLSELTIEVSDREYPRRGGTCWPTKQRVVIYQQPDICEMLMVGLHEMAHAVEVGDHHGEKWQRRFAVAIAEVTGITIPYACEDDYHIMDRAASDAIRRWWRGSSYEFAAKLLGVR